jgi:DinB family protein
MKPLLVAVIFAMIVNVYAQEQKKEPATLKSILLEQLRSTHNKADWFVPANTAIAGLTPQQAAWTDGKNHSVGQLTYHLVFWDKEELAKFKGEPPAKYSGKNDDTFNDYDPKKWDQTVKELDQVLTEWEKAIESADDAKIKEWASGIAHVGTHNAYHIGEIVMVRKEQGSWNPETGVK